MHVLHSLPQWNHPDVIVGTETSDDAGVFRLRPDLAIVNTVDFFTPIVDDPYTFGQIAAANALSDIYAMGAEPRTALNIVGFPSGKMDIAVLGEILKGGSEKVREAGAVVIGGHTIIDDELKYGMAITGEIHPDRVIRNVGLRDGDAVILTKPLGTGIITTALKQRKVPDGSIEAAIASMVMLNRRASEIMRNFSVHACTDVTGYGLLGHAVEMASGGNVTLVLESAKMPLLPGALELAEQGILTGGCKRNRDYLQDKVSIESSVSAGLIEVAFDPQTSGGLLIGLPKEEAQKLLNQLQSDAINSAAILGYAAPFQNIPIKFI
jgi:selenide, water dikinase